MSLFDIFIVIMALLWVISLALECPNRLRWKVWWVSALLVVPFPVILIMGGHLKSPAAAPMEPRTPAPCSTELRGGQQKQWAIRNSLLTPSGTKAGCPYMPQDGAVLARLAAVIGTSSPGQGLIAHTLKRNSSGKQFERVPRRLAPHD